jgi:hypothetical protein
MNERLPTTCARLAWVLLAWVAFGSTDVAGQAAPERPDVDESTVTAVASLATAEDSVAAASSDGGGGLWGSRSPRRRLIPALWGMHFFDQQPLQPFWTRGAGFQASGWFGGAFMNSYDDLSVIAGIEREWGAWRTRALGMGVGYRAGLLTGYDRQLFALADKTPVLPFVGLDVWLQAGPVAFDVFYVYRALSLEASIAH